MSAYQSSTLFRGEVAAARRQRLAGEIILSLPLRPNLLTLLLAGIVAALAAWALLGTYTRSEIARGILVTALPSAKVVAIRPGQVAALHVADGQAVRAGQPLATILVEQAGEDGASATATSLAALAAQAALAQEQIRLSGRRAAADRARLAATRDGLARQRASLADQIALQEEVVASAKETFERIGQVVERGFVSRVEFESLLSLLLYARERPPHSSLSSSSLSVSSAQSASSASANPSIQGSISLSASFNG